MFWDMRDSFLFYLYHGGVEGNRIDGVLPEFDRVRYLVLFFPFAVLILNTNYSCTHIFLV